MIKFKLGVEPLQNNLYHNEGTGASKICKLCSSGVEDAKHFLFTCPALALPRENLKTAMWSVYGINNVMLSENVFNIVNPPLDSNITKLANLANSVYHMLRARRTLLLQQ